MSKQYVSKVLGNIEDELLTISYISEGLINEDEYKNYINKQLKATASRLWLDWWFSDEDGRFPVEKPAHKSEDFKDSSIKGDVLWVVNYLHPTMYWKSFMPKQMENLLRYFTKEKCLNIMADIIVRRFQLTLCELTFYVADYDLLNTVISKLDGNTPYFWNYTSDDYIRKTSKISTKALQTIYINLLNFNDKVDSREFIDVKLELSDRPSLEESYIKENIDHLHINTIISKNKYLSEDYLEELMLKQVKIQQEADSSIKRVTSVVSLSDDSKIALAEKVGLKYNKIR